MATVVAVLGVSGRDDSLVAVMVAAPLGLATAWLVLRAGNGEALRGRFHLEGTDA
jgi:hypothetical protein